MKKNSNSISRREFCMAGGGLLVVMASRKFSFLNQSKPGTSEVILVKTADRAKGVAQCMDLLGINPCSGKNVLIKPNFNTADPAPGSTHNDTLRAILAHVKEMGSASISIGDRSGPQNTEEVFNKKNIPALAGEFDAQVINFDALKENQYETFNAPGFHWENGFLAASPVTEAECLVQTCCLKTHQYGGIFTMSLKNSVGIVPREDYPYMRELHSSSHQRKMIAEINAAYSPDLIILDGIEAFVDGGPMTGEKKQADVFLAGTDRVAIDSVGVAILKELGSNDAIMKTPVFQQEQISRAVELKLGATSPSAISIKTGDKASRTYADKIMKILHS